MKYSKRYIAFTVVILFVFLVKFHVLGVDNASVGRFRGGTLEAKVWNPLVAKDVNSNQVKALIDNQEYTSDQVELYMNKDRNIMVPVSMLRDALNCSARVYDNDRLLVEKHNLSVSLSLEIRNQGTYGTCWAFAATSALESSLLPEEKYLFSVDNMSMSNSFHANQYDGGEYTMGMAYLAAWQGPVLEKDDPYGDGVSDDTLKAVKHVQEMQIIDGKDYEGIKEAVFKYGGVESSLYSTIRSSQDSSAYYNRENSAYCYIGTEKPNHDVVIIGWDDNYPSSNFNTQLEGDGAFICQNSWGSDFGEDGIFYVSYYDTNIGTHNVVYTRVDDTDNYDKIYQSDLCGWVGNMGYGSEQIYGANVFQAKGNEKLSAASFYATGANTEYELYVVHNFKNEKSFANREKLASGIVKKAGYYTVDFDEQQLKAGEKYAIVLYVKTPGSKHPLAIEYDTGESILQGVDLDDGEGYISLNGKKFVNAKEKRECNLCIKAFTRN